MNHLICLVDFLSSPANVLLSGFSFSLAYLAFSRMRTNVPVRQKLALVYTHIAALIFPFALLGLTMTCNTLGFGCHSVIIGLFLYALPATVLLTSVFGFALVPMAYTRSSHASELKGNLLSFLERAAKAVGIRTPGLYSLDRPAPFAFSFSTLRPSMFLSVGLLDILNKKEIEAVVLHELAHIANKDSLLKMPSFLLRLSPFSFMQGFGSAISEQEKLADEFAAGIQGTDKHLLSAKRKIEQYNLATL